MSTDGAHDAPLATRPLRENEAALLLALLAEHPRFATFHLQILSALVTDLLDGGMGSIRFSGGAKRVFGDVLA